jgi:hypothetical protein
MLTNPDISVHSSYINGNNGCKESGSWCKIPDMPELMYLPIVA